MTTPKQPQVHPKILKLIEKIEKIEIIFLILFLILILLKLFRVNGIQLLIIPVMSSAAILYFSTSFKPFPEFIEYEKGYFVQKLSSVGCAIGIIGVMFGLMGWPGDKQMLIAALLNAPFALIMMYFVKPSDKAENIDIKSVRQHFQKPAIRLIIIGLLSAIYFLTPREKLVEIGLSSPMKTRNKQEQNSQEQKEGLSQLLDEFQPKGDFSHDILFEVITHDSLDVEIFGDTIIPWISLESPETELEKLVDRNEIVIQENIIILIIDYPVKIPTEIPLTSPSENGFTRGELITLISKEYHRIYEEEAESSTVEVTPVEERKILNRNTTNGKYGIWGHDLSDLDLSYIEVRKDNKNTYLYLGVES